MSDLIHSEINTTTLLEEALTKYDTIAEQRQVIVNKLTQYIDDLTSFDKFDKASTIEAKVSMLNTLNSLLKDIEDAPSKKLKLALAKQNTDTESQQVTNIKELLKQVALPAIPNNIANPDAELDRLETTNAFNISEGELVEISDESNADNK